MRYTTNANSIPLLHVSFWCKPRGIRSVLSVKYVPKVPICNTKHTILMKLENYLTQNALKFTEFTYTLDLHLIFATTNTRSFTPGTRSLRNSKITAQGEHVKHGNYAYTRCTLKTSFRKYP